MNKILFFLIMCMMLVAPIVMAADLCTESTSTTNVTFWNSQWNVSTNTLIFNSEQKMGSITGMWIIPKNVSILCENHTIYNGTTSLLKWQHIGMGEITSVRNASTQAIIYAVNYTFNNITGALTWNFSGGIIDGNVSEICYVRSIYPVIDDISDSSIYNISNIYSLGTNTEYGEDTNITFLARDLNNTNMSVMYTMVTKDCGVANSCKQTQTIVFAGFGLIALFAIILAAWAIITAFSTGDINVISIALVVSVIGLGFIVMVGYIIVANVGQIVCGV